MLLLFLYKYFIFKNDLLSLQKINKYTMTKKKRKANYFYNGGPVWDKNLSFGKNLGNAFNSGALNSVVGAASSMAGQGISGGLSSGVGNAMQGLGSIASAIPGPWGAIAGAGLNIVGGLVNKAFGSQINEQAVQEAKAANTQQSNMQFAASNTADLLDQSNFGLLGNIKRSDIGKDGWFSDKAKNLTAELNRQRERANQQAIANFGAVAENVDTQNDLNALANYAAYGGPLTMRYTGTMSPFGNIFANGGNIHISPSKRGTFTAAAKKHGKSVQSFASQVLANKENYSSAMVKKANFARNASKWKHEEGGPLKKKSFEDWYKTVPVDRNDTTSYNLRRAYELAPYNELEAWRTSSIEDLNAGKNHLRSVYRNPNTGVYEFMKSKNHPTLHFETDWYNSNDPEAVEFRKNYDLDMSGDYYKYVPKKKAFGGDLNTNGGDFSNGPIMIGNGGTHEENPMEGVQMGVDGQGIPNLVEEGEVIFNDYVFSNRMKVPKAIRSKYKLREKKGITFADAAKRISKESEERPNDPISQNGLKAMLGELATVQEDERLKKQMRNPEFRQQVMNQLSMQGQQQYAQGGLLGKKYAGLGAYPNTLESPDQEYPYAFYGNNGKNKATNPKIVGGWANFTDNNGNMLYNPETGIYSPDYLGSDFQYWLRSNYGKLSKDWWNSSNAPDYFKAGNKSAPTIDQMIGTIFSPGLMYDKQYGEAHDFGRYAYNQYRKSFNLTPPELEIKGLELPKPPESSQTSESSNTYPTWMRYAPIAAAGVGVFTDALGWTNKPDYSNADAILDATANGGKYTPVSFNPLGNYLTYQPFDRNYYINKLNAQAGATRRAIMNQSAGNRSTALAGILAADYNAQGKLGDLARQAEEYNLAQKEKVATFNRGTDQFNSEMGLKAAMANQSALANLRDYRLKGTMAAAEMREKARMLADANRSANLTNFVQGLGDIGSENIGWNQLQWAIDHGVFGPMQDTPSKGYRKSRKGKNGGKLLTKNG